MHYFHIHNSKYCKGEGGGGGGVKGGGGGGGEDVRPENIFSKNREREITFTEIRERKIRK